MLPCRVRTLPLATMFFLAGCSGPPALPTLAPNAEMTVDGLYRMDNSVMALGYAKPDLDLTPYTAFMLDPVEVAYQKDPGNRPANASDPNYALSEGQMETLKRVFQEEVERALTENDGYEIVTEPGPNVGRLSAYLVDLVVRVQTDRTWVRETYADSYGEVTMVLELRDSQSGEILARVADRQDPTSSVYALAEVNTAFVRSDVTRLFQHWATTVRDRLDQLGVAASMRGVPIGTP